MCQICSKQQQPRKHCANFKYCDKMNFEENILNAYSAAVEMYEHVESYFHEKERRYPIILQELRVCYSKIDFIISLEADHNIVLPALFQQRQQLNTLIGIVENIIKDEIIPKNKWFNEEPPQLREPHESIMPKIKKKKIDEDPETSNIVRSTIQIPKCCGLREIVGLHDVKKTLKSLVILPKTQPQLFQNRRICNSILLFGPPGTGKTHLAHALAAEAGAVFHCISASDIFSHYVGQTEKTIKMLFQYLKESSNFVILFIDEIDGFCRKRTEGEQEHTRRIKTELMCQMSSIEDYKNMFVVCATNCPWDLDSAILRRFQKRIYVPLPDQFERLEFFQFFTKNIQFQDNFDNWIPLIEKTDGYSGSDLSDVVQNALNIPLNELEDTKIWKHTDDGYYEPILGEEDFSNVICSELSDLPQNSVKARKVHMTDLLTAADNVTLTVSRSDVKKYEQFNRI